MDGQNAHDDCHPPTRNGAKKTESFLSRRPGAGRVPILIILSIHVKRGRRLLAPVCFWWDGRSQWALVMPTLVGIKIVLGAGRIFWWNAARKRHLHDQMQRISSHAE
jgi:hypothetical protein